METNPVQRIVKHLPFRRRCVENNNNKLHRCFFKFKKNTITDKFNVHTQTHQSI